MTVAEVDIAGSVDLELRALDWLYTHLAAPQRLRARPPAGLRGLGTASRSRMATTHFELRVQLAVVDATTPL